MWRLFCDFVGNFEEGRFNLIDFLVGILGRLMVLVVIMVDFVLRFLIL